MPSFRRTVVPFFQICAEDLLTPNSLAASRNGRPWMDEQLHEPLPSQRLRPSSRAFRDTTRGQRRPPNTGSRCIDRWKHPSFWPQIRASSKAGPSSLLARRQPKPNRAQRRWQGGWVETPLTALQQNVGYAFAADGPTTPGHVHCSAHSAPGRRRPLRTCPPAPRRQRRRGRAARCHSPPWSAGQRCPSPRGGVLQFQPEQYL